MKKFYAIANFLVILAVIFWNYWVNVNGVNGNTVASLSDRYDNLFTPAGYAFSIWGLIFLGLFSLGIFQIKKVFIDQKEDNFVEEIGPWLLIANIGNASWLWFWLNEQTGLTILLMLGILTSLLICVVKLGLQLKEVSRSMRIWVWAPIGLYSGWITVATIANISAYLAKIGWQPLMSETSWAVVMILIATLVNLGMLRWRNMTVFAGVGVWAILAISMKHWDAIPVLQWFALTCAIVLAIGILLKVMSKR